MKTSIIYAYIALMGMTNAQDTCVEGKRITISPGYTVEYKCDKYRSGELHKNVLSHQDCAAKCQVGNLDVCTYQAAKKMCIVGDPNGKEGPSKGATYMVRVKEDPEDPFAEKDPFAETCEEERDNLRGELDRCRADLEASSKKPATCGLGKWGQGWYKIINGMNLANCKNACNADAQCLSYSGNKGNTGAINCYLYAKETADLTLADYPNWVQYDKRCK
ncbi:hypothetical protein FACUT_5775 [Fusarium acutatum]|uniref:Apple domain-containing protein n=1 Tax=Fusarium acutatum TaxID=78861 RepID=A0A8H4JUI0_9HYPO|nr:hypothetical protein FACUT_5775 [Fusarium acutatum]